MTTKPTEPDDLYCEDCKQVVTVSCVENDHETTDARPDLIETVEKSLAKRKAINPYVKSVSCDYAPCENCNKDWCGCECHDPTEEELSDLLRRLVEENKRLQAHVTESQP